MRWTDLTAIGRPVDARYPTNLAIVILTMLVTAGAAAWKWLAGAPLVDSAMWGIGAGLATFLTWVLGRELDPDHDLSAFVAAGLALVALPILGLPQLLPLFWMVVAVRVVNRTVGLPARPLDSLALLGLGLWLTWQAGWLYGLITAATLFLDGWLPPRLRRHLLLSAIMLTATVTMTLLGAATPLGGWDSAPLQWLYALTAILFAITIVTLPEAKALCDATGEPLRPARVRAGQVLALVTALLLASLAGEQGLVALSPLWAAMLGVALYELATRRLAALRSDPDQARDQELGGAG
jgi:hypothetical protein